MNQKLADPSSVEIQEWFLRFAVGYSPSYLTASIQTAYGDFSRTLHGIGTDSVKLRRKAAGLLETEISGAHVIQAQPEYDVWHERVCVDLRETYWKGGYRRFQMGQAQKWLNMALKYYAFLGALLGPQLGNTGRLLELGHMPIDRVILEALSRNHGLPAAKRRELEPWSGIKEYETYRRFQPWVRKVFPGSRPLTVDFHLWRNEMAESRIRDAAELVASNQG